MALSEKIREPNGDEKGTRPRMDLGNETKILKRSSEGYS